MDNNEKKEYDSLSEMLTNNKERKKNSSSEPYQNPTDEDYHDIDDFEDSDVKRYDVGDEAGYSQNDTHDIDFDEEAEEPEKAVKRH